MLLFLELKGALIQQRDHQCGGLFNVKISKIIHSAPPSSTNREVIFNKLVWIFVMGNFLKIETYVCSNCIKVKGRNFQRGKNGE